VPTTEIAQLWTLYAADGETTVRNRLVLQYAPLVKYVAGRVRSGLPLMMDQDDLVSEGVFGLLDAIEKFDLSRGIEFQTYAVPRIKGAIIDALRAADWVPRSVRHKMRTIERTHAALQERLGRVPTDQEVAGELQIPVDELRDLYTMVPHTSLAAVDDLAVIDERFPRPGESLEDETLHAALRRSIRDLPERQQIIIALYYFTGFTLAEIGQVLQISESRVSQLHTRAIIALRGLLAAHAA